MITTEMLMKPYLLVLQCQLTLVGGYLSCQYYEEANKYERLQAIQAVRVGLMRFDFLRIEKEDEEKQQQLQLHHLFPRLVTEINSLKVKGMFLL